MVSTPWLQFTGHQPKRKRAELACTICHSKKIRCDLQTRTGQGLSNCTNCETGSKECRMRPSRRITRRNRIGTPLTPPDSSGDTRRKTQPSHLPQTQNETPVSRDGKVNTTIPQAEGEWLWNFDNVPSVPDALAGQPHQANEPDDCSPSTCRTDDTETRGLSSRYYELEIQADARSQEQRLLAQKSPEVRLLPSPDLQQSFIETYQEYCLSWCPVLDRDHLDPNKLSQSPLLANALAVAGSHTRPPVMPHDGPAVYYERARNLFYNDAEPDVVRSLQAISLFYWWSPRPPSILHRHSSWWWTSVVIRHCQQLGVHQQPSFGPGPASSQHNHPTSHRSHLIRRRIWWTAFARERLTAICQGKPCTIDSADCDIAEPTLDDFPDSVDDSTARFKAEIFIYWVKLCGIIGRIAKYLNRPKADTTNSFPIHLARDLISWVHSLPPDLKLPIHSDRTTNFNRDVHQLHLPYLAVIIMLHLKQPYHPHPEAYPPAILAASCMARLFRDILARGGTHYLMAITGWYTSMAFIALLQATRVDKIAAPANEDLDILTLAVDQLRKMWPTANIFHNGFQRLRPTAAGAEALLSLSNSDQQQPQARAPHPEPIAGTGTADVVGDNPMTEINWLEYFPFATAQTSGVAEKLLAPQTNDLPFEDIFPDTMVQFQDLFADCNFEDVNLFI
ncbi:fungal-specific transcription factor domain-containing protein [Aspergillus filifer]